MGELCMSSTTFKPQASLILSCFTHFCGFILSHPLYFSYFIFFSPYLLKLVSFLSPLFITTSFLLLLLGLAHHNPASRLFEFRQNILLSTFHVIQQSLREKFGLESQEFYPNLEECEAYKIVFASDIDSQFEEEKRLQDFFDVLDEFDDNVVEKNVDSLSTKSIKVVEEHVDESKVRNNGGGHTRKVMSLGKPFYEDASIDSGEYSSNLGSYGSMRKEKEWRRTLACKLFEERHNAVVEGDERIDALWERHESDELSKSMRMATDTNKKKKSTILNFYGDVEEEDDNEEFEITKAQLCCLQAFKFSAGKMNLGMRRPNLVKFSKALKGIGWLHSAKRHGKKEKF